MAIDHKVRDKKNCDMILTEKQQKYQKKIDKYEYLTGEEILSLGKAYEKQIKTIEDQGKKQIKVIEDQVNKLGESNDAC